MKTTGGGIVRFVDLTSIPFPGGMGTSESTSRGTIEIHAGGIVTESFEVHVGDNLFVSDGADVAPGRLLGSRGDWLWRARADLGLGKTATIRWKESLVDGPFDEVTGLQRFVLPEGEGPARLDLIDNSGTLVASYDVPREAWPRVVDGQRVAHGELLAVVPFPSRDGLHGITSLRAFLNGRIEWDVAAVAPCDGIVEAVEASFVMIRGRDDRLHRVRRRRRPLLLVFVGSRVRAGDALDGGTRSHHQLLRIWGEDRLAVHVLDELEHATSERGLAIPRTYWALVVRAMLTWRRILRPGDTGLRRHQVLSRSAFERVQRETAERGGTVAIAAPALRGLGAIARATRAATSR